MANGIEFCTGCKHNKAFKKAGAEPTYLNIVVPRLLRLLSRAQVNIVEVLDENLVPRTRLKVPNVLLEQPEPVVKQTIQSCTSPFIRSCGAEIDMVEMAQRLEAPMKVTE